MFNKFEIYEQDIPEKVLLKCILKGSAVMNLYSLYGYYTSAEGKPRKWVKNFYKDMVAGRLIKYKKTCFVCIMPGVYFWEGYIYSFDAYYADCPIFNKVYDKYQKKHS